MNTTRDEYLAINKVIERIKEEGIAYSNHLAMLMDLDYAHQDTPMDFEKLLAFDRFNFIHDIYGIANNLNRKTKEIENCFVPRCSK